MIEHSSNPSEPLPYGRGSVQVGAHVAGALNRDRKGAVVRSSRLILSYSLLCFLIGCKAGSNYHRPAIRPPATFRGAPPATAKDPASLADLRWFDLFKDEQLQALIRRALAENYDLRDAIARVDAARANLGITRSDQFPTITGEAFLTMSKISSQGQLPFSVNRIFGTLALNLLSFEVDVWGRLRRATEAARADLLASEETRKAVITTLISDVATQYFNLLELDMELGIARRTLATRQDSLNLIRMRERGGVATALDLRQGEQLVYGAETTIPDIERLIEQTENQINLLLGRNPGPIVRGRRLTEQEQPPSVPPGLPSSLLERRPDILAAEQNLVAANADIGVAKAAYFPQITLTGFLGTQTNQLTELFSGPSRIWQFIPDLAQPIFTGGRLKSTVNLAEANHEIALIQYERIIQTAFREVSDALIQYQKVRQIRAKQDLLVTTLQDRSRLAYLRYRGGVDTLLSALDADRDLFAAELVQAQVRRDEQLAIVQLYKALGGGWQ